MRHRLKRSTHPALLSSTLRLAGVSLVALWLSACGRQDSGVSAPDVVPGSAWGGASEATPAHNAKSGPLTVGAQAPDLSLPAADGTTFDLSVARQEGAVVLIFYRGDWCPICRKQLKSFQAHLGEFTAKDAKVVAISVDDAATSQALANKLGLTLPILVDADLRTIRAWGIEHKGHNIAKPSTFVIAPDGTIRFIKIGDSAGDRPDLDAVLAAVPAG